MAIDPLDTPRLLSVLVAACVALTLVRFNFLAVLLRRLRGRLGGRAVTL